MTEEDTIRALDKMICDREELLRQVENSTLREKVDALKAIRAKYCSRLDFETEYKIMQKRCKHAEDEMSRLEDECDKLHAELEEAKHPKKHYFEVLFPDGSSVRVENAASWFIGNPYIVLRNKSKRNIAVFKEDDFRMIIEHGKRENDED